MLYQYLVTLCRQYRYCQRLLQFILSLSGLALLACTLPLYAFQAFAETEIKESSAHIPSIPAKPLSSSVEKPASPASEQGAPVLINAETMTYDRKNEIATASGRVELYQNKRMLLADKLIYNKKTDTVTAEGNVSLLETNGDVYFANHLVFTDQMKQGVIQHFRIRFADNSLFAANNATRVNKDVVILRKAVYSPCSLCKDNPSRPPSWQIKADKATIDNEKQTVSYRNAFFETYGIPVMYAPVFSHAMPGSDRKSGFLVPTYSNITSLGSTVKIPYYVNIAPDKDATLTPYLTSAEGPVMSGEYRQLTANGFYQLSGSITNPDDYRAPEDDPSPGQRMRGHLQGNGLFHMKHNWDAGFNFKQSSDDTYLSRYKFGDEDFLTTRVYAENIDKRDYTLIQGLSFQELTTTNDTSQSPFVLPLISSHKESERAENGSHWTLDSNAMILSRKEGTDSRRLSSAIGWEIPYISSGGQMFNLSTSLRGDIYDVADVADSENPDITTDGAVHRFIPQTVLDWRFPLVKEEHAYHLLLEPAANVIISPYGGNPSTIPNEDSQEIELSDNNLFSTNRFTGLDRVEDGVRTNYGLRSALHTNSGKSADFLFGQSYRPKEEGDLPLDSGLEDNFSDYVGRVGIKPSDMLNVAYRFRLDKSDMNPHRNEIDTTLAYAPVVWNLSYIFLNDNSTDATPQRKQIYSSASVSLSKQWTITADARRDLSDNGGMVSSSTNILYHGDCVNFITAISKEFTRDQDIKPSTSITFQIFLKNLN